MTEIVLVSGAGGVGKTTLAAGIGVASARSGQRTLVLTVDPARRLATALGLQKLSNVAHPNPDLRHLWAAMLDAGASWEAIARRHAPPDVADRLVASPFFDAIARQFPAGAAYAAGEEMAEQVENGAWDVVVVDTPPSSGGVDFLTAPGQMRSLVGGRVLRILTGGRLPGRKTFFDHATKPALRLMDNILGGGLLQDVGDFLFDLRHTYDGIAVRSSSIAAHLESAQMVLVTTTDPSPLAEAERFVTDRPGNTSDPLVVFNRSLPEAWIEHRSTSEDDRLVANLRRWSEESTYQRMVRTRWASRHDSSVVHVPWRAETPTDIDAPIDGGTDLGSDHRVVDVREKTHRGSAPRPRFERMIEELPHLYSGKVRDMYAVGDDQLLIVTTDRLSAFDVVMAEPVPDKGRVLTAISAFWFDHLADIAPHHLLSTDLADFPEAARVPEIAGRSMLVRKAEMLPIECIVRGYITGSAWKEYRSSGTMHGAGLPEGLLESEQLPEPVFTPSTKAEDGLHDENISFERAIDLVGVDVAEQAKQISIDLYSAGAAWAAERGIIIADTKFELGFVDGQLVVADEMLTPDSSRFWPEDGWQPGTTPPSFDKQPVRDHLEQLGWNKLPPPPALPEEVIASAAARYIEGYERITGRSFSDWPGAN